MSSPPPAAASVLHLHRHETAPAHFIHPFGSPPIPQRTAALPPRGCGPTSDVHVATHRTCGLEGVGRARSASDLTRRRRRTVSPFGPTRLVPYMRADAVWATCGDVRLVAERVVESVVGLACQEEAVRSRQAADRKCGCHRIAALRDGLPQCDFRSPMHEMRPPAPSARPRHQSRSWSGLGVRVVAAAESRRRQECLPESTTSLEYGPVDQRTGALASSGRRTILG